MPNQTPALGVGILVLNEKGRKRKTGTKKIGSLSGKRRKQSLWYAVEAQSAFSEGQIDLTEA